MRELRRVARDRVVILTYDAQRERAHVADGGLPARGRRARPADLPGARDAGAAGSAARCTCEPLPMPRDTPDWMLGSFWAHPERVLDEHARANTSGFARMPPAVVRAGRDGAAARPRGRQLGRAPRPAARARRVRRRAEIGGRAGVDPGARRPIAASPFLTRCGLFFVLARIGRPVYGELVKANPIEDGECRYEHPSRGSLRTRERELYQ